jgi:hypothetical protein
MGLLHYLLWALLCGPLTDMGLLAGSDLGTSAVGTLQLHVRDFSFLPHRKCGIAWGENPGRTNVLTFASDLRLDGTHHSCSSSNHEFVNDIMHLPWAWKWGGSFGYRVSRNGLCGVRSGLLFCLVNHPKALLENSNLSLPSAGLTEGLQLARLYLSPDIGLFLAGLCALSGKNLVNIFVVIRLHFLNACLHPSISCSWC